jgi:hypothetical protein
MLFCYSYVNLLNPWFFFIFCPPSSLSYRLRAKNRSWSKIRQINQKKFNPMFWRFKSLLSEFKPPPKHMYMFDWQLDAIKPKLITKPNLPNLKTEPRLPCNANSDVSRMKIVTSSLSTLNKKHAGWRQTILQRQILLKPFQGQSSARWRRARLLVIAA